MDNEYRIFTDQTGRDITISFPPKRIISLVPSQTELLFDLGLDQELIGITKFCVHPEIKFSSTAKVGGTKTLNIEKIRQLQPDLILANKEENTREQIVALMQEFPVWISDIYNLNDAMQMIREVAMIVNQRLQGDKLIAEITGGFDALPAHRRDPLRVAYLIWKNPYMVAGHNTFIHNMLAAAGWENVFTQDRYPEVSGEEIAAANPDVVFLSSEPYPFKEIHIKEFQLLCPDTKILIVDGELFSWYGSRLKYTADYLNELQLRVNQ